MSGQHDRQGYCSACVVLYTWIGTFPASRALCPEHQTPLGVRPRRGLYRIVQRKPIEIPRPGAS